MSKENVTFVNLTEEEKERKLLGVADRIGVATAEKVITNLVNRPAHVRGQWHWFAFLFLVGCRALAFSLPVVGMFAE